ncbi:DSD1 family PLP-dependent enzyme [Pelagibius litoralis]|uniref:DSD1 family PLP-dependent enzyme n=2 Tax=Pelagibius litoralis TaxID=374515 RepID=A0A967F0M5_9PROT|nr:DSD1 family PLP-dependent enzyme [Pelagibius litoralis]
MVKELTASNELREFELGPNEPLIGLPGSRERLTTPCLSIDLGALDRNIQTAASHCREARCAFRPHTKTHKSVEIALKQLDAGAQGICVANIGEAEIFAAAGIDDILITSPFVSDAKFDRLMRLLKVSRRVAVVVDHIDVARRLAAHASQANAAVPVYLDIDTGRHRTGVSSIQSAVELARLLTQNKSFEFIGLQAYAGHLSHLADFSARMEGAKVVANMVREVCVALHDQSITVKKISGGSMGTIVVDAQVDVYSELQYGSYVFSDVEYQEVNLDGRGGALFEPSLFVRTTVISKNWPGMVTTDAGHKHFAGSNGALPRIHKGGSRSRRYEPRSDEHGAIYFSSKDDSLEIGDCVECLVPHCDPTVNLYSHYHVVDGDTLVDIWPVDARGAF